MPLLERVRVEAYIPDLPSAAYRNLLLSLEVEFTYAFGGCTIARGRDGSYLSNDGDVISDRVDVIYTDLALAFSADFQSVARYAADLKQVVTEALDEERVFVAVLQVYHVV